MRPTKGIVSGSPSFFRRAFGDTYEDYESILVRPHRYIFNRDWYETMGGQAEFEEYQALMSRLSDGQKQDLLEILAGSDPWGYEAAASLHPDPQVRGIVLGHYLPLGREGEREIWNQARAARAVAAAEAEMVPDDMRVEDAGLYDDDAEPAAEDITPARASRRARSRSHADLAVGGVA